MSNKILPLTVLSCLLIFNINAQISEINRLYNSLPNITDSFKYINAINRLGFLLYEKNADSTFFYAVKAREASDRLNYIHGKADALNNLGVVYDMKGDLQLSLRYYNSAHTSYVKLRDSSNIIQTLMNMALVFTEIGDSVKATKNFQQTINLGKTLAKDSIMSLVYSNYVFLFSNKISQQTATVYLKKAKQIAEKYNDNRTLLQIEQLEGVQFIKNGYEQHGIDLIKDAVDKSLSMHLFYLSNDMLINLGDFYAENDSSKAVYYYKKALSLAEETEYAMFVKTIASRLYYFYKNRKNETAESFYAAKLIQAYDKEEQLNILSSVDYIDYALKEEQLEKAILTSEGQKKFIIILIGFCLLSLITGLSIYKLYIIKKKNSAKLKLLNNDLHTTLISLENSQVENSRMMHIIAHDLRNPVSAIMSFADLMSDGNIEESEMEQVFFMIRKTASITLSLIKDLLHLNIANTKIDCKPIDLKTMIQYCINLLQSKAAEKNQQIIFKPFDATITGDKEKLWRVFSNLITNAIKFSNNNATITICIKKEQQKVIAIIKDEGIGIPQMMQHKMFNIAPEAKRKGTAGEPSFGLGLFISKQIVESHKGEIWFESEAGKGTTFFVSLPFKEEISYNKNEVLEMQL